VKTWKSLLVTGMAVAAIGVLSGTQPLLLGGGDARAVVGRPLTPMSYAGVARRTSRRTVRRSVGYGYGAPVAGAAVAGAAVISTLPAGCGFGGGIYTCGSVHYRPYYDGPTVVYQVVQ
jgi:hypothetical protein